MAIVEYTQDGPSSQAIESDYTDPDKPSDFQILVGPDTTGEKILNMQGQVFVGGQFNLDIQVDPTSLATLKFDLYGYADAVMHSYSGSEAGTTVNFEMGWTTTLTFESGSIDLFRDNTVNIDLGSTPYIPGDEERNYTSLHFKFDGQSFDGLKEPVLTNVVAGRHISVEGSTKFAYEDGHMVFRNDQDMVVGKFQAEGLDPDAFYHTPGSSTIAYACFLKGTNIATPDGEIKVENLKAGDEVLTKDGSAARVKWIGHRLLRKHQILEKDAKRAFPILFKKGCIADKVPQRDLVVSPGHHLCIDGNLIPAMALVNDISVVQLFDMPVFQYFHVELEQFDILLAEGAPAESYVDTGNRNMFQNAAEVALNPDFGPAKRRPKVPGITVVRKGPVLEAIRAKLLERAEWMKMPEMQKRTA